MSSGMSAAPANHATRAPQNEALKAALPAVADLRPLEVRIRKLHVLRPDLLRFPMQYDIYC